MTRVMDGGCTFSCSASSPGVMAWWPSRADRAASWVSDSTASVKPEAVRWARRRRASRLTAIRSAVASPASVLVWVTVVIVKPVLVLGIGQRAWTKYITLAGRTQQARPATS